MNDNQQKWIEYAEAKSNAAAAYTAAAEAQSNALTAARAFADKSAITAPATDAARAVDKAEATDDAITAVREADTIRDTLAAKAYTIRDNYLNAAAAAAEAAKAYTEAAGIAPKSTE